MSHLVKLFFLGLLFACCQARADTPIVLFKSYAGNLNFVGLQKTMRTGPNGGTACNVVAATTNISATLTGIPATATVVAAHLYWAGSSSTPDYTVNFDGVAVTALPGRQFTTASVGYDFFSGAADVTAQVVAKRNATYTFSGMTISNGSPYCAVEAVLGGYSLVVIYSQPTETFRVLNLYEGFQYIRTFAPDDIQVNLNLTGFKIPNPLSGATGRIAHITWEGDTTLSGGGETLQFNGQEMLDALNPTGNQFNSVSSINNDNASYGIDFDAYTVASPKIASGQTSATTNYKSSQDMVLLSAEIVAVPNVPVADLIIDLGFTGTAARGNTVGLTHTVTNAGPYAEPGPTVVRHTLATGLTYVSAAGTGWTCSVAGQVVTCSYGANLAINAVAPLLTINATISATAPNSMTTNATVAGTLFDNNQGTNADSYNITFSSAKYVFTNGDCVVGIAFGGAGQTCQILNIGTQTAGLDSTNVYITALDNTNRPANPGSASVNLQFAVSCHNPVATAGIIPRFNNTNLKTCIANGAPPSTTAHWTSLPIAFASGKATSARIPFNYADVGRIELFVAETSAVGALTSTTGQFVVKPYRYALAVTAPTPNPATGASLTSAIARFRRAGENFPLTITVLNFNNVATPNFGKEIVPETIKLDTSAAVDSVIGDLFEEMVNVPALTGSFGAFTAGAASGSAFNFSEVGIINLLPGIGDGSYLEVGNITGPSINVGRFYPNHFETDIPIQIACPPSMPTACVDMGMHYSRQPVVANVRAYNMGGVLTRNYQGEFAKATTLSTFTAEGGATSTSAIGTLSNTAVAASAFVQGAASVLPTFTLLDGATPYMNPVDVYLRAADADTVTSLRAAGLSVEGGTRIVRGRLQVVNAYGSELLKTPAQLIAQYWTGGTNGRYANSSTDNISITSGAGSAWSFKSTGLAMTVDGCLKSMAGGCALSAGTTLGTSTMSAGIVNFKLNATGLVGSANVTMNNPVWLPSTVGRFTFGVYKPTPLIYIREVF